MVETVGQLIDLFGGPAAYAREVGMTPGAAKQAKRRNSLNARWFTPTVQAAERLQKPITLETLADIAGRREAA